MTEDGLTPSFEKELPLRCVKDKKGFICLQASEPSKTWTGICSKVKVYFRKQPPPVDRGANAQRHGSPMASRG